MVKYLVEWKLFSNFVVENKNQGKRTTIFYHLFFIV